MRAPEVTPEDQGHLGDQRRHGRGLSIVDPRIMGQAAIAGFRKLDPRVQLRNPVMFVVEIGAAVTTIEFVRSFIPHTGLGGDRFFTAGVSLWLWFTVLFANFAEGMAEGRGKAQADTLRRTRTDAQAKKLLPSGQTEIVSATELRRGDMVLVEAGDLIPGDGEVVEGVASVNEAAITGESAPVIKEPGTDIHSSVTGGTTIVSDWLKIRITANPGETFIDRMIALVEGANRQKTPNEIALNILLASLAIIFLLAVWTLQPFAIYSGSAVAVTTLVALLVCLIPTTIGGLLSAIGIAGMDRLVQFNVLAMSGRAVEAAGDVDTLLLDKTGTITFGNRLAFEFIPLGGHFEKELIEAALRSSLADETPEGKSIVTLCGEKGCAVDKAFLEKADLVPFTAETRMSGVQFDGHRLMKGAVDAIEHIAATVSPDLEPQAKRIAEEGGTPLAVLQDREVLGLIYLKDTVKPGMIDRFSELRRMGIRTVMVTGDNRLTAATIAREAGVDDFVAESKPEDKIGLIRNEQAEGKLVAMTGDGTNDAPALAQADVGMAMNSGTQAAKEAGNMVDLDNNPTKLIEVVAIGKQLLITRGALTTFSISNDVAKYFAILPAMFSRQFPQLDALNVMHLATPHSAVLSAVIFNALIIVALIPLALKGVKYRPIGAASVLRRNLLIYGLGGVIVPFAGIKLCDLILAALHLTQ
ncbi:MAG TPA: potassium-transporting ATPase subunit KdpB [Chloroflexota bacterium]|nr:potassium-transporting ATPase subunit KdpB [Chloroflexota bacterium]